jgi:uncharacterized membrane-anchored protein YitT (DUF2179 family)
MWPRLRDYASILVGALVQALAMDLFLVPGRLAAGGVSGLAQIINGYTGWPIGLMILIANAPLFALGLRYLGGRRFLSRTIVAVLTYAVLVDLLARLAPAGLAPGEPVLNSLYGGVLDRFPYGCMA